MWRAGHPPSGIGARRGGQCYTGRNWGVAQSMTYCGGILVREGLVMFADTRTNAGVDNISTFRKLHVFKDRKNASWRSPWRAIFQSANRWSAH
jgi:hypothetical protein